MMQGWSEPSYLLPAFAKIAQELAEQAEKKNNDYGQSVGFHGAMGLLPRLADKFFRLNTLVWENKAANYESAADSARDLASYAIILAVALEYAQMGKRVELAPNDELCHYHNMPRSKCWHGDC